MEGDPGFLVFWVSLLPWSGLPTVPVLSNGIYPCPVWAFRALFSAIGILFSVAGSGLFSPLDYLPERSISPGLVRVMVLSVFT